MIGRQLNTCWRSSDTGSSRQTACAICRECRHLEQELQRELNFPGGVVRVGADDLAERRIGSLSGGGHQVGGGIVVLVVGDKEAGGIGQVEELRAELHLEALLQLEILEQGDIKMPEVRSKQAIAARGADHAQLGNHKRIPVKNSLTLGSGTD